MFDFDRIIDRKGSDCVKWDMSPPAFQTRPGAAGPGSARQDSAGLLPLWVADMDFASPPAVCQAIRERAEHPVYGYALRPEGYLDAFADWMRLRHGAGVERPWLLSTPGIVAALAATIRAFSREGDGVCIMPPVYHPFARLIRANGRRVEEAPLRDEGGRYAIDLDALDTAASRSKLLILCSPHNPVGRVWTGAELEAIAEIASRRDIVVMADEIHADLVYAPARHIPSLSLAGRFGPRLVAAWAPSKTFNIAGLQASVVAAPDEGLRCVLGDELAAEGVGEPNCFAVAAAQAAYREGGPWLDELLPYLAANYAFLRDELAVRAPALRVYPCEGSFLAWMDFRGAGLSGDVYGELAARAGLWLDSGSRFGTGGDGFARLNFGCPRRLLAAAVDRLAAAFGPARR